MTEDEVRTAEQLLGYEFEDPAILKRALTHASLVDSRLDSNERMEFLGDAILGMIVCDYLYAEYEDLQEGEMTKIKSSVVSRHSCAVVAEDMGMGDLLRLGKGMTNNSSLPRSVVSAVYESIIGAVYLDGGLEVAREFILKRMKRRIERAAQSGHQQNFKSVLQQGVQRQFDLAPQYVILDEKGPDHAKCFEICVEVGARRFGSCWGASKKQAEQQAALQALVELGFAERAESGEVHLCRRGEAELEEGD